MPFIKLYKDYTQLVEFINFQLLNDSTTINVPNILHTCSQIKNVSYEIAYQYSTNDLFDTTIDSNKRDFQLILIGLRSEVEKYLAYLQERKKSLSETDAVYHYINELKISMLFSQTYIDTYNKLTKAN